MRRGGRVGRVGSAHLGVVQSEEGLQVGDQVWVDALQRLQQRNSEDLSERLLGLRSLLMEAETPETQRSKVSNWLKAAGGIHVWLKPLAVEWKACWRIKGPLLIRPA